MAEPRSKRRTARRAKNESSAPPSLSRGRIRSLPAWAAALLIVAAGSAAYSNSFDGVFVFDDEPAIEHNPHVRSLWPLATAMAAPPDTTLSGRPFASLTFAISHGEGSLAGHHAVNLGIHLAAALVLFGVLRRTRPTSTLALVVAVMWVVHPLQTASVTYIVQRVESLMGLLYLATLYCAIRALEAGGRAAWSWTAASVSACALGMATKETMVTAPLMVMLWDRQFAPERAASRRGLHLALAATWIVLAALVAGGPRAASVGFGFPEWPWWRYLMTQAEVVAHYLRLAIVPAPLVLDYEWPAAAGLAQVALPGLLLLGLLATTLVGSVRRHPAAFAGAWFFLILAPTSSVVPIATEVAAEHRMYLPLAGVIALIVLGLAGRVPARVGLVAATAVAILFVWLTRERNADYHDHDRIWTDTIAKRPHNARARNNYAASLLARRRFAEAVPQLRVAVRERASFVEAQANLGVALAAVGALDEGILHLQRAIQLRPDYGAAHRNLGEAYALQRRFADAARQYEAALAIRPDDVGVLNRIAWILATSPDDGLRDGGRAKQLAGRAVLLTARQDPVSLDSLGAALAETGEFPAAAAAAREALALCRRTGDAELAAELEQRARLYERGLKFRAAAG